MSDLLSTHVAKHGMAIFDIGLAYGLALAAEKLEGATDLDSYKFELIALIEGTKK